MSAQLNWGFRLLERRRRASSGTGNAPTAAFTFASGANAPTATFTFDSE
jgi:hypothetical protein